MEHRALRWVLRHGWLCKDRQTAVSLFHAKFVPPMCRGCKDISCTGRTCEKVPHGDRHDRNRRDGHLRPKICYSIGLHLPSCEEFLGVSLEQLHPTRADKRRSLSQHPIAPVKRVSAEASLVFCAVPRGPKSPSALLTLKSNIGA